jgi:hypothetical protein
MTSRRTRQPGAPAATPGGDHEVWYCPRGYHPMVQILELSYGPLVVLPEILAGVGGQSCNARTSWHGRFHQKGVSI